MGFKHGERAPVRSSTKPGRSSSRRSSKSARKKAREGEYDRRSTGPSAAGARRRAGETRSLLAYDEFCMMSTALSARHRSPSTIWRSICPPGGIAYRRREELLLLRGVGGVW